MKSKLTLTLNKEIIEQAKSYAKDNDMSLSELIETYLASLTKRAKISSLVESLTGIIPDENCNYKKDYSDYLSQKH